MGGVGGTGGTGGVAGSAGTGGVGGATPSVDVFGLISSSSWQVDIITCSFSDALVFQGVYEPIDIAEGQQVLVHTQFDSREGPDFTVRVSLRPVGGTDLLVQEMFIESPTRSLYEESSLTGPLTQPLSS
jgi:hypothetical protein